MPERVRWARWQDHLDYFPGYQLQVGGRHLARITEYPGDRPDKYGIEVYLADGRTTPEEFAATVPAAKRRCVDLTLAECTTDDPVVAVLRAYTPRGQTDA